MKQSMPAQSLEFECCCAFQCGCLYFNGLKMKTMMDIETKTIVIKLLHIIAIHEIPTKIQLHICDCDHTQIVIV